jgi:hypothetical protein
MRHRTKQYYQFIHKEWTEGDSGQPPPPPERKWVRNRVSDLDRKELHGLTSRRNGSTCTSTMSFPCLTSGSTRGSQRE